MNGGSWTQGLDVISENDLETVRGGNRVAVAFAINMVSSAAYEFVNGYLSEGMKIWKESRR